MEVLRDSVGCVPRNVLHRLCEHARLRTSVFDVVAVDADSMPREFSSSMSALPFAVCTPVLEVRQTVDDYHMQVTSIWLVISNKDIQ